MIGRVSAGVACLFVFAACAGPERATSVPVTGAETGELPANDEFRRLPKEPEKPGDPDTTPIKK